MSLLLDTCVLYWLASDQAKLSAAAVAAIHGHAGELRVSAILAVEVAMNHRKGRVVLPAEPEVWLRRLLRL